MLSDFDSEEKIVSFPPSTLGAIGVFIGIHGANLPIKPLDPNSGKVKVVCGRIDRIGSDDLRPCVFPEYMDPILLTNGEYAFKAFWTKSLIQTILDGSPNALILTQEQFDSLKPEPLAYPE